MGMVGMAPHGDGMPVPYSCCSMDESPPANCDCMLRVDIPMDPPMLGCPGGGIIPLLGQGKVWGMPAAGR